MDIKGRIKKIITGGALICFLAFPSISGAATKAEVQLRADFVSAQKKESEREIKLSALKWLVQLEGKGKKLLVNVLYKSGIDPDMPFYLKSLSTEFPHIKFETFSKKAHVQLVKENKPSLNEVLSMIGVSNTFTWIEGDTVDTAVEAIYGLSGSQVFNLRLKKANGNWSVQGIISHEISCVEPVPKLNIS